MSTRSTIAILNKDGTVESHYCHSDGYLSYNGEILYTHYRDLNKIKELINLGSMSSLDEDVSPPKGVAHSFDKRCPGVCTFYGRDRGEENIESTKYDSINDYLSHGDFQEYDYIYNEKKKQWYLIDVSNQKLKTLASELKKDSSVSIETKKLIINDKELKLKERLAKQLKKELPNNQKEIKKYKI